MDLTEPVHRKVIGIAYIAFSILGLFGLLFYDFFMSFIFDMATMDGDFDQEFLWVFDFINKFVWAIGLLFLVPRIFIGFGLINQRKWADTPALIYAVIGLINIPIGTALGVYAIITLTSKPKSDSDPVIMRDN